MHSSLGHHWIFWFITLVITLPSYSVRSETLLPLDGAVKSLDLLPYAEHWVENGANRNISLKKLLALDHPNRIFLPPKNNNFSFGYTKNAHWFRWKLRAGPASEGEWWLQIAPTFLDAVDLYVPQDDGSYQKISLGDHVPQTDRPMRSRHFLAALDLTADNDSYYYLRVQSSSTVTLALTLWRPAAYAQSVAVENTLYGLLFGLILATMMVSLISGLWIRQKFYFAMAAFLFCNGLLHFTINGYDQLLFYEENSNWPDRILTFSVFAAGAAGINLCLIFLKPLAYLPRFTRVMWLMVALSIIGAIISVSGMPLPALSAVGGVLVLISITIMTLVMLRHRFIPALLMLILFVPGFLTLLLQIARNFSLLPLNFWTTHVWAIMTVFQVPYIALVILLHLRAQEKAFLSEQQKTRLHRDLFSMVAHELRTPLAVVGSAIANIELQTQHAQPELAPRFARVNLGLSRLNSLIDNALAEDRLLDQGIQLQKQSITLEQLIEQVRELRPVGPPHHLHFHMPAEESRLFADPHWLGLAVFNLLDNAIKYSPEGGSIHIDIGREGRMLSIAVADEGIGVPSAARGKIFDKFYRADNAVAMKGTAGMGLGLFLVQTVVSLHGGHLKYRPNSPSGSVFILCLPLS